MYFTEIITSSIPEYIKEANFWYFCNLLGLSLVI